MKAQKHLSPVRIENGRQAQFGASWWDRLTGLSSIALGSIARKLRVPGAVRDVDIQDEATGHSVSVRVGTHYTRIRVNGRDYFFGRFDGRFDGTGLGCD